MESSPQAAPDLPLDVVLPGTVPSGSTKVTLTFPSPDPQKTVKPQLPVKPGEESACAADDDALTAYYASLPKTRPAIAELKEEAARKHAERFKDGHDALQKYCGCLAHIYTEDGAVYQRQWRAERDREWDT
jgi:hypothetical protein